MSKTVILYTIDCPKCKILERKLKEASIEYETVKDVEVMAELGISSAPVLSVDGKLMQFNEAMKYIMSGRNQ